MRYGLVAATTLLAVAAPAFGSSTTADLTAACERVYAVYPRLMLATMLEGEVNCGDPDSGEFVSCNEGESADARAARERRLAIRRHQEAGYELANTACRAWDEDRTDTARVEALERALSQARATDDWTPE